MSAHAVTSGSMSPTSPSATDAGRLGELDDGRIVVAELGEHVLGCIEQALARLDALARERAAAGAGNDDVGHRASSLRPSSCFCTLPMPLRGISATRSIVFGT